MPDVYGPFDGSSYGQAPYYRDRGPMDPSGVVGSPAASAAVGELAYTTNGLTGSLQLGRGHVRGASYERTGTAFTYTHPANTSTAGPRLDRVVLRRDPTAKTVVPAVLQGTAAASPTVPAVTQVEDGVWELPLHTVSVPANSGTTLTVTDERVWIRGDDWDSGWRTLALSSPLATDAAGVVYRVRNGFLELNGNIVYAGAWSLNFQINATALPSWALPNRKRWVDLRTYTPDGRQTVSLSTAGLLTVNSAFTTNAGGGAVLDAVVSIT